MSDPPSVVAAKRAMRRRAAAVRAALPDAERAAAACGVAAAFLRGVVAPAGAVSGYWPFPEELDPRPLMAALAERGRVVALPVVVGRGLPLLFRCWRPGDEMSSGVFGTSVPGPAAPATTPAVLLVPLLAWDAQGYRLGYGGGYYDRTLAALRAGGGSAPLAVGVGFAAQQVEAVPRGPRDARLDWMVTEREARRFD